MHKSILYIIIIFGLLIYALSACQKELFCPDCSNNLAPIANAGRDTIIVIPGKIILDGKQSKDADGTISHFKWQKLIGPDSLIIVNDTLPVTTVEKIKTGLHIFELTVTDNLGLSDKDTVQVFVNNAGQNNKAPVARAGNDSTIRQLSSGIILDGSVSTDADNNIAVFEWIQISTSPVATITNPLSSISLVNFAGKGTYSFLLRVTDSTGLSDTDTITFTIETIADDYCAGIIRMNIKATTSFIGSLSMPRRLGAAAAAGSKIVFAGGYPEVDDNPLATVDIYDVGSSTWSHSSLSSARVGMATIVYKDRIFFAGGIDYELDAARGPTFSIIDIYNASSNGWNTKNLSEPKMGLAATQLNGKLYFAGGATSFNGQLSSENKLSKLIDIYSPDTDNWDTDQISTARFDLKANSAANKIYFAGGSNGEFSFSPVVDILNPVSDAWSAGSMNQPRTNFNSISFENKIMWAGGYTIRNGSVQNSSAVEIFDAVTGITETHCLNSPTSWLLGHNGIAQWKNWIVIFPDLVYNPKVFEIYNITNKTWHLGILDRDIYWPSIVVAQNKLFVADGASGKVWNINF